MTDTELLDFLRSSFASLHERLDHIDRRLDELTHGLGRGAAAFVPNFQEAAERCINSRRHSRFGFSW